MEKKVQFFDMFTKSAWIFLLSEDFCYPCSTRLFDLAVIKYILQFNILKVQALKYHE